jgi:endonuclease-3
MAKKAKKRAKKKKNKIKVDKAVAAGRVEKIFSKLKPLYPQAKTALKHKDSFQLLIATILSAQCTDARVNIVTKDLFKKYKGPADFVRIEQTQLENDIRPTGFYRNKAKNIKNSCRALLERFEGKVPGTLEELVTLPGVGRKTANVILGDSFGIPGITCDTHVIRLSRRLGLSENSDPVKLEFDLMEIVPKRKWGGWTLFSHLIIYHGRNTCKARKPDCGNCVLAKLCPSANNPQLW